MKLVNSISEMQNIGLSAIVGGQKLAFVPTMGFFHDGHLSLMRWAKEHADEVVVSLYVNPAQFAPNEDLDSYPRDIERDMELARDIGVDHMFFPSTRDLYPAGFDTWVEVPGLSRTLCGRSRPQHFRGVSTIVCKLLNIVRPFMAVFGQKDRQQLLIIEKMVKELNIPVLIEGRPTCREADGLAMSSRNSYLSTEQRNLAPHIYQGLRIIKDEVLSGNTNPLKLEQNLREYYLHNIPGSEIDYIKIVDANTLEQPDLAGKNSFMAVAVRLGRARLIDNIVLG